MVKLKTKYRAATIIESIVAMIIIVLSVAIGVMIFENILKTDHDTKRLKAASIISYEAVQAKANKRFISEEKQIETWTLTKQFEKYRYSENAYQLTLSLTDENGNVIFKQSEIIIPE